MPIDLAIAIYERGDGGVPGDTLVTDLGARASSYEHAINAHGGFESMRVSFACSLDEAVDWLANGAMRSTKVFGPDAQTVWEGYLSSVAATIGQETRAVSMELLANHVTIVTNVDGLPVFAAGSDSTSIATYGTKQTILSVDAMSSSATTQLAALELKRRKFPQAQAQTRIESGGDVGEIGLTLTFAGWYYALDWLIGLGTVAGSGETTTQAQTILTAYRAVNPFLSLTTSIPASGLFTYSAVAADVSYRTRIDQVLAIGNSSGQGYTWGVYDNRVFSCAVAASESPTVITYQRSLGDARLLDAYGNPVAPWDARPDTMYSVIELSDPSFASAALDAAARMYVERVALSVDESGYSLSLEPAGDASIDALIQQIKW